MVTLVLDLDSGPVRLLPGGGVTGQQPTQLGVLVSRNQDGKHQNVPQFVMELLNNPEPALECEPSALTPDL